MSHVHPSTHVWGQASLHVQLDLLQRNFRIEWLSNQHIIHPRRSYFGDNGPTFKCISRTLLMHHINGLLPRTDSSFPWSIRADLALKTLGTYAKQWKCETDQPFHWEQRRSFDVCEEIICGRRRHKPGEFHPATGTSNQARTSKSMEVTGD
jgi:hypothetical protein